MSQTLREAAEEADGKEEKGYQYIYVSRFVIVVFEDREHVCQASFAVHTILCMHVFVVILWCCVVAPGIVRFVCDVNRFYVL